MSDDTDLIRSLAELVTTHTPELVHLAPNGVDDGQHYYCVQCGVLPADTQPGEHVAVLALAAVRDVESADDNADTHGRDGVRNP